jgi:signal transduction histidine kinase/ligand-binding sensor domain-containing protein
VGTWGGGLFRLKDGRFTPYTARHGLAGDRVRTIYQDPEGDLWVGTEGAGLIQLRDGRFGTYTTQDGLPNNQATTVYEDAGGSIWVGTAEGLSQFRNGAFTVYTTKDGLPSNFITSICEDRQGSLWFSTNGGISRFKDGRFTTWTHKEGLSNDRIFAVLADRAGNLWIGTYGGGLNRFRDGHFSVYTTRDGLANNDVLSLFEDRLGSIWIGTLWGGLSRFKDGRFTTWTTKDGLASNHVLSFYEDRAGNLWIGTHGGGLNRFKDGKFATIKTKDGLYDNLAFRIMEDDGGDLWMSGNKGIYRASLKELNDFAEGRITLVNSFSYDESDGMLSRECNGGQPAGCKMRDGRLWFPTVNGVVVVDPRRHNLKPPLVAIEQVILDRETLPAGVAVRIRPGEDDLEVQYTGLSWNRPGQVKFKFQMVGLDRDWVSAGTRRTAYYSHLAPGRYTFRVIADNGDGVWDMGGASLPLVVLPPFYRTWWFIMLALSGVAAALSLIWRLRVAQLERAHTAQQAFARQLIASQESERKRIATELHDSLGQRLVVIKNLALMFLHAPGDNGQTRARIEEISTEASQAIGEVKEISYNLRPYQLDRIGLTKAVEALAKTASAASEVAFSVELDDIDDIFPQESQINFYRIVQESVNNIVKHSQAKQASVRVRRNGERLLLAIRDDGKGFTPGVTHSEPRQGGFGLIGISERAQLLGGKTVIQSAPGQGTAISIEIDSGVLHRGR